MKFGGFLGTSKNPGTSKNHGTRIKSAPLESSRSGGHSYVLCVTLPWPQTELDGLSFTRPQQPTLVRMIHQHLSQNSGKTGRSALIEKQKTPLDSSQRELHSGTTFELFRPPHSYIYPYAPMHWKGSVTSPNEDECSPPKPLYRQSKKQYTSHTAIHATSRAPFGMKMFVAISRIYSRGVYYSRNTFNFFFFLFLQLLLTVISSVKPSKTYLAFQMQTPTFPDTHHFLSRFSHICEKLVPSLSIGIFQISIQHRQHGVTPPKGLFQLTISN